MLNEEQNERYARHIMLDNIGEAGQERLLAGKVIVIGAGGLGSPVALYLAAAGVGTIGVADFDIVELSNLQRQIIHSTSDIGRPKAISASDKIMAINPDVQVVTYLERIESANVAEIIKNFDFVIDASDNFDTKFLINDACMLAGKPFSHGGILRYDGQTITVVPGKSPCYRCIFPDPPRNEVATACSRAGVIGVLPGIIGTVQATEAMKFLLGAGNLLTGRLLTYNALSMKFREVPIQTSPHCPLHGRKKIN